MTVHAKLISGDQELVISVIGELGTNLQGEIVQSYEGFKNYPGLCTVDLSLASNVDNKMLDQLTVLPKNFNKVRVIGCDNQALRLLSADRYENLFEVP